MTEAAYGVGLASGMSGADYELGATSVLVTWRAAVPGCGHHRGIREGAIRHWACTGIKRLCAAGYVGRSRANRSRRALPITDTELKLMAAAAMTGLNSSPKAG